MSYRNNNKITKFILAICFGGVCLAIWYKFSLPVAVVVPHHDFVAKERKIFFQRIKLLRPNLKHIIIIGPDHFSTLKKSIIYSDSNWKLSKGELFPNKQFLKSLKQFTKDNLLVKSDHTVANVMPDLVSLWPNANVSPLLIGDNTSNDELNSLLSIISSACLKDCLLVASVDFSHYLPWPLAAIHDMNTFNELKSLNLKFENKLEVDSPKSLYLLSEFSKSRNAINFKLFDQTNSAEISGNSNIESTSHFFGSYTYGFKQKSDFFHTYTLAKHLNTDDLKFSDRYLYGTEIINLNLDSRLCIDTQLCINPINKENSGLSLDDDVVNLELGEDLLVSVAETKFGIFVYFVPSSRLYGVDISTEENNAFIQELFHPLEYRKDIYLDSYMRILYIYK